MKLSRLKAVFVLIIMSVLCLAAIGISVWISIAAYKKQDSTANGKPPEEHKKVQVSGKTINKSRIKEQVLYFNGQKLDGLSAYLDERKEFFLPIDAILKKLNIKFNYFSPDDILEANVNGGKILVKLGRKSFSMGEKEIPLKMPAVAAMNHILIPLGAFSNINGFKVNVSSDKNTAFMNYYPDYDPEQDIKVKILRVAGGMVEMSDIPGKKLFWEVISDDSSGGQWEFSNMKSNSVLKFGGKVYVIKAISGILPQAVNADFSATLSLDGKYLYWIDESKKTSFIYDIGTGKVKNLGDYYLRIKNDEDYGYLLYGGKVIYDYKTGSGYKRVALTNTIHSGVYIFIERNGKPVIEGNAVYSPDMKKILYRKNKKFYTANADGTNVALLGNDTGEWPQWVSNNKIFLNSGEEGKYVFTKGGKNKAGVDDELHMVGRTPKGSIFFTEGNSLYCEVNGVEKEIMKLPWKCSYICADSSNGPYIAFSDKEDGVFLISRNEMTKVGKNSLLLKGMREGDVFTNYEYSTRISPDKRNIAVFQRENGFIALNIISSDENKQNEIILNCRTNDSSGPDYISSKWISNGRLLVYTARHGWIIDIMNDIKIYEWEEQTDSTILDAR